MTKEKDDLTITFRCPPELESILPKPVPAVHGLPDWFKSMPQKAFNKITQAEGFTLKKCPPFIDAMTYGFLMPLVSDLHVDRGTFSWDRDVPGGALADYPRSPIDFHDGSQVAGSPFFAEDEFIIKFNNFWTIAAPSGYSLFITHPVNRGDLPFVTLTGMVDSDLYKDNFVNFPAKWSDPTFSGVLPKGTPVAQCVPVKRENWNASFETITGDAVARLRETANAVGAEPGAYRRHFRVTKR